MKAKKTGAQRFKWKQGLFFVGCLLFGAVGGFLLGSTVIKNLPEMPVGMRLLVPFFFLFGIYAGTVVQLILHETGHLLFGMATGYRFCSFRIFHTLWMREKGKLCRRRYSIPGTAGQCLMVPPEMKDGRFPVILYNFGGVIMNLLSSAVFLGLYFLLKVFFPSLYLLWLLWLFFAVMGVLLAVTNGIPLRVGMVDNDGRNALSLANDPEARRAFWIQLKMNEQITAGRRLREMPEQWFAFPTEEKTQENSMTAATAVFSCNRLMDEMRFAEADARMARLLASGDGMVGLHRNGLLCDRIYCLLLAGKREEASRLTTPALRKFLRAMKENPSALRTEYVLALLLEGDKEKAAMLRLRFAKAIEKHPYAGEALSEKELIAAAEAVGFPEKATV